MNSITERAINLRKQFAVRFRRSLKNMECNRHLEGVKFGFVCACDRILYGFAPLSYQIHTFTLEGEHIQRLTEKNSPWIRDFHWGFMQPPIYHQKRLIMAFRNCNTIISASPDSDEYEVMNLPAVTNIGGKIVPHGKLLAFIDIDTSTYYEFTLSGELISQESIQGIEKPVHYIFSETQIIISCLVDSTIYRYSRNKHQLQTVYDPHNLVLGICQMPDKEFLLGTQNYLIRLSSVFEPIWHYQTPRGNTSMSLLELNEGIRLYSTDSTVLDINIYDNV